VGSNGGSTVSNAGSGSGGAANTAGSATGGGSVQWCPDGSVALMGVISDSAGAVR
jgi:hypothetical protein